MRPSTVPGRAAASSAMAFLLSATAVAQNDAPAPGMPAGASEPPIVVRVGTVHPVGAPAFENGVIVTRMGRIVAIGAADAVDVPADATVFEYPDAHAYPGLVDAWSEAFVPTGERTSTAVDAASEIELVLDESDELARQLAEFGVTTAYVCNQSSATWRGVGAIVRPKPSGIGRFRHDPTPAVHLRLTGGDRPDHALNRTKLAEPIEQLFDSLEDYERLHKKHAKSLEKYEKEFAEYLEHHEKNKAEDKGGKDADGKDKGAKDKGAKDKGNGKDANGVDESDGKRKRKPAPNGEREQDAPDGEQPTSKESPKKPATDGSKGKKDDKAPKRPKYPKEPTRDPAKEMLIEVRDGKRALRVEAHRGQEIDQALHLQSECGIDTLVLEGASAAGDHAEQLADRGVAVVLTEIESREDAHWGRGTDDLVARLHRAGVPLAIASGGIRRARNLPTIAARAAALGLGEDAAIRAITLTPAEIIGVAEHAGSLTAGKIADVVITSAPLLRSDARIVQVLAAGRPVLPTE